MILDRKGRDSDRRDPRSFRFRERQMAASLLITIAGRVFAASDPGEGSKLTAMISPRRIQLPRPSAVVFSQAWASPDAVQDAQASS
jgi:hypothetical protein